MRMYLFSILVFLFMMGCDPNNPPDPLPLPPTPDPPSPCFKSTCGDSRMSVFCGYFPHACEILNLAFHEEILSVYPKKTTCGLTTILTWRSLPPSPPQAVQGYYDSAGVNIGGAYYSNVVTECGLTSYDEFKFRQYYGERPSCCMAPPMQAYPKQ